VEGLNAKKEAVKTTETESQEASKELTLLRTLLQDKAGGEPTWVKVGFLFISFTCAPYIPKKVLFLRNKTTLLDWQNVPFEFQDGASLVIAKDEEGGRTNCDFLCLPKMRLLRAG
jgi:hypothetical protein